MGSVASAASEALNTPSFPSWSDPDEYWQDPPPISEPDLALWREGVNALGDRANVSCGYTRQSAPCAECGPKRPLQYIEAATHSLTLPGFRALGAWFDAPVAHDVAAWHNERYDSRSAPAWTLLAMDGAPPTPIQIRDYAAEKSATANSRARLAKRDRAAPESFHPAAVRAMFASRPPSLTLARDGDRVLLGSPPDRSSATPMQRATRLTWSLDAKTGALQTFDQRLLKSYSPHFGLRFAAFVQRGVFGYDAQAKAVVVTHQEYSFRARLTMAFAIANHAIHWYSEFDCGA